MDREELYELFVTTFNVKDPLSPFRLDEIDDVEREIKTVLPESYVFFVKYFGPVYTPQLRVLLQLDLDASYPLQDFSSADEVLGCWQGVKELPERSIPFAADSKGNLFCFKGVALGTRRPPDQPVFVFDHEGETFKEIAPSFDAWLEAFLKLA